VIFEIQIDDHVVRTVENTEPVIFHNMMLYASDPWYPQQANVHIKNLKYRQFPSCNNYATKVQNIQFLVSFSDVLRSKFYEEGDVNHMLKLA